MTHVELMVPDGLLLALRAEPGLLAAEILMAAAVKLYEIGRLSSGAASEMAGVPKPIFLSRLADYGVDTFRLGEAELRRDMENA